MTSCPHRSDERGTTGGRRMDDAGWGARRSFWLWGITVAVGTLLGVGAYTFIYARAASYLTDKPEACINCHVMQDQYAGWMKGGHRSVAVCNDCHTPDGLIAKYTAKAMYGVAHAYAFTTGRFPDEIRITPHMHALTERACLKCHADIVDAMSVTAAGRVRRETIACIRCHGEVGHR